MLKAIEFSNFRNLNGIYKLSSNFNVIFGKNNAGKTNFLEGLKLAFSIINSDSYYKVTVFDFADCDDSKTIEIKLFFDIHDIPTLDIDDGFGNECCGCIVKVFKTQNGIYRKNITYLNNKSFDIQTLHDDLKNPTLISMPVFRIEDIYADGLSTALDNFIESDEYEKIVNQVKDEIREKMSSKIHVFKEFCKDFDNNIDIEFGNPIITKEKASVIDGKEKQNIKIGSGYKSIANIFLNLLEDKPTILTIDEIENHLHPSMIRKLIKKLASIPNIFVICTTHSTIVVNEVDIGSLITFPNKSLVELSNESKDKLTKFLTVGRSELLFCEKFILVEGYTEKLLLEKYCRDKLLNWTIINTAGVMFSPYIELANFIGIKGVIISDSDICLSDAKEKSVRFVNLNDFCKNNGFVLIEMKNTLESDLYESGFLTGLEDLLQKSEKHSDIFVAKPNCKTKIATMLIKNDVDISDWHIVKEIECHLK